MTAIQNENGHWIPVDSSDEYYHFVKSQEIKRILSELISSLFCRDDKYFSNMIKSDYIQAEKELEWYSKELSDTSLKITKEFIGEPKTKRNN